MPAVAWLSDIHLNFLDAPQLDAFYAALRRANPDAILLGGDIAEAGSLEPCLGALASRLARPLYFVLGNHDFYGGSIAEVRARAARIPGAQYLTASGVVHLSATTALVGHDSWADGRYGDFYQLPTALTDYFVIRELAGLSDAQRLRRLHELGDAAAAHFRRLLPEAFASFPNVMLLTHVPPFREACWHQGRLSTSEWLPHFACKAVGDVLLETMRARPACRLTVLCGHTHSAGHAEPLPNLRVFTAGTDYGAPRIERLFTL